MQREGKMTGDFSGPKNFIKEHLVTVASRTAEF